MSVKKTSKRLLNVLIALVIGYFVVYAFAAVSKRSKGPLGGFLENVSDWVKNREQEAILGQRENLRSDKLSWFKDQRKNKFSLLKTKYILFGASDDNKGESYENIFNLEDSLALTFPIIGIYAAWGENQEYKFPSNQVDAIIRVGSIPMITWEPWLEKFSEDDFPEIAPLAQRNSHGLASVAKGHYDSYIKEWALDAKKVDYPIYLRWGHEMNDPYRYPWGPQNNDPEEFVAAFKHIKDVFDDTRSIAEPAGALSVAGLKKYVEREGLVGENLAAIISGANMNFDRLRHISERTELGEKREAIFAVTIPETPGSFKKFCDILGGRRAITEFNYRYSDDSSAVVFVGVRTEAGQAERKSIISELENQGYQVQDMTDNEMAKLHLRYMVGGRPGTQLNEKLYSFEFPEQPGALLKFLRTLGPHWNITLFHYRNHGSAYGRVLAGFELQESDQQAFSKHLEQLGFDYRDESDNTAYQFFLAHE